jgi:competence protein ComEC
MPRTRLTTFALLLAATVAVFSLACHEILLMPDGASVLVRFLDVGQGDSAFITGPSGQHILIDGGPDLSALEGIGDAMPFFDRTIDILVLTHPHLDHVASFPEILRRYHVGEVIITGAAYHNGPYEEFLTLLKQQHIPILVPEPGKELDLGDHLLIDLLWPPPIYFGKTVKSIHDTCIVLKLRYGDDSVLFTGDMEVPAETTLLQSHVDVSADILKVAHHGSKTSSSVAFLKAVHPKLAVISVAAQNSYGLPYPGTLQKLQNLNIPYQTTISGTIVWKMDGKPGL